MTVTLDYKVWESLVVNELKLIVSNAAYEDWQWLVEKSELEPHELFAKLVKEYADNLENESDGN